MKTKIEMEDREDDDIVPFQNQIKEDRGKKHKKRTNKNESSKDEDMGTIPAPKDEELEFVEFVLGDFKNPEDLNKFKNMKSLTLIQQGIKSIGMITKFLPEPKQLEYLCLNENILEDLLGVNLLENLKDLQVNCNFISKIEFIQNLSNLQKLWICENKIKKIESLPKDIQNLAIAANLIESISNVICCYPNITDLNISANLLNNLEDIYAIQSLPKLKTLCFNDINFGENPLCIMNNYRVLTLHFLRNIETLDQIVITEDERKEVENIYLKKNLFYKNKIRHLHKINKSVFLMLKTFKTFYTVMKSLQIKFFDQRIKMLHYAIYEKTIIADPSQEDDPNFQNLRREIENSKDKMKKCLNGIDRVNQNYKLIKKIICEVNDLMIVSNFYEMESGGNLKIEPGNLNEKWTKSCMDLMKTRLSSSFLEKNSIKGVNFLKLFKIANKKQKIIFDNCYDTLLEENGKFGDEKKYYDFFFLHVDQMKTYADYLSFFFEDTCSKSGSNPQLILANYLDRFEDMRAININKLDPATHIAIICKCITFDSLIDKSLGVAATDDLEMNQIIKKLTTIANKSEIVQFASKDKDITKFYYLYRVKAFIVPEFLIEYEYVYNSPVSNNEFFVSSFTNKIELREDCMSLFNNCCKELYGNKEMKINGLLPFYSYFDQKLIQKYKSCKFSEFEDLDTSALFFVKNSIFNFLNKTFKFENEGAFKEEIGNIYEKIKEISELKFQRNYLDYFTSTILPSFENSSPSVKLLSINLFNCQLSTNDLDLAISQFSKCGKDALACVEEFKCGNNLLESIELNTLFSLFPKLKILDVSHNIISHVYLGISNVLTLFDISFNQISHFEIIINILTSLQNLNVFNYFGNPYEKVFSHIPDLIYNYDSLFENSKEKSEKIISYFKNYSSQNINDMKLIVSDLGNTFHQSVQLTKAELKNFDLIYETYSFSPMFQVFSESKFFREKVNQEKNSNALMLSKRKLSVVPRELNKICDLTEVKILYLNLNKITEIENLEQFAKLEELYLQNNKIIVLKNLNPNLLRLDLSNNLIENLSNISHLVNLTWLNIENNMIKNISAVVNLSNLNELHCAGNSICCVQECLDLKLLPSLFVVDLSGNEVCRMTQDFRIYMIFYLPKLKSLNRVPIDKTELLQAKEYFNGKLTNELMESKLGKGYATTELTQLDLSSSKLRDFEAIFDISSYPKLIKLNLSRNLFQSFKIFGSLPSLIELNLTFNAFTELLSKKEKISPLRGICGISNLEALEISNNSLTCIYGIQFLKSLKSLVIRENNINKIDYIDNLQSLSFLDLSFNKLRSIEKTNVGCLPYLKIFLCDSNYLKNINAFSKLTSINVLSFENNKVTDMSNLERLAELSQLKEINLNNNPVTKTLYYRSNMIKRFLVLTKLDGIEISKEEREMLLMDVQMQCVGNAQNDIMNYNISSGYMIPGFGIQGLICPNSGNYVMMNQPKNMDKALMKVNFVNLDFICGGSLQKLGYANEHESGFHQKPVLSPPHGRKLQMENYYSVNLPQIKSNSSNVATIVPVKEKSKAIPYESMKKVNAAKQSTNIQPQTGNTTGNNLNIKPLRVNTQLKLNSIVGSYGLFRKVGESISNAKPNETLNDVTGKYGNIIQKQQSTGETISGRKHSSFRPKSNDYKFK